MRQFAPRANIYSKPNISESMSFNRTKTIQTSKSFRHFAKHLFIIGRVYVERKKAQQEVDSQLERMRKSIFRMSLSYNDIDKLKEKISNLINWERKYAKFFKPKDNEMQEMQNKINALEQELKNEKEEKYRIKSENDEKIRQLTESINNIKNQMRFLHLERAKRHHRLKALENKINEKIDVHSYFS